jgi:hypothetical protein
MSRISSILGYLLFALIIVYFSVSSFIENRIETAIKNIATWSEATGKISFDTIDFSFFSGKLEVTDLKMEQLERFNNISADRASVSVSWHERFRFLMEQDFNFGKLQNVAFELHGLKMFDAKASSWTAGYSRIAVAGELRDAVISFLQQKETRKSFKSSMVVERANIVPPPEFMNLIPVAGFIFPIQNLRIESVYDPGIYTLRSDFYFTKRDTSDSKVSATVVFDDNNRKTLLPKRAVLGIQTLLIGEGRQFQLNDAGNELSFSRTRINGAIEMSYVIGTKKPSWVPEMANARIALVKPVLYPSAAFLRQYSLMMQTFGFENGFAQFDSVGGNLKFKSGLLLLEDTRIYADWLDADVELGSSLFQNKGFDAPIQNGVIKIRKMSPPITAGVRFVERQTQKKLFKPDGTLVLELAGNLNAPKIKGLF